MKPPIIQYVPCIFQFEQLSFIFVLRELNVFEVLDYGSHLAICCDCAIDGLGLICQMDTWLVEELYRDDLQ